MFNSLRMLCRFKIVNSRNIYSYFTIIMGCLDSPELYQVGVSQKYTKCYSMNEYAILPRGLKVLVVLRRE